MWYFEYTVSQNPQQSSAVCKKLLVADNPAVHPPISVTFATVAKQLLIGEGGDAKSQ